MTHEELLEKVKGSSPHWLALRGVIERHTYVLTGKKMQGKAGLRKRCTECGFAYPCPTIEVIIKEIG